MFKSRKSRLAKGVAVLAVTSLGALAVATGAPSPAGAEPQQYTAAIGMGSDTTQFVLNAYAGFNQGTVPNNYTPIQSSAATGSRQVISFNALDPTGAGGQCIVPKPGAPALYRPFGSTEGRHALSQANGGNGAGYGPASSGCGNKDYGGYIDFARSSSGPAAGDSGTDLTYIPMGRDALSFAYYKPSGSPVTALTSAQLGTLFTTAGPQVIGGVSIYACGIQLGSGTYKTWLADVSGGNATSENTATNGCNSVASSADKTGGRLEENNPVALKTKGDAVEAAHPGAEVVIGFSASNWVALQNGVTTPSGGGTTPPASVVGIGTIDGTSPTSGTGPYTPNGTFFANATYGRNVWIVMPTSIIAGLGNNDLKTLFVGSSAAICAASTLVTLQQYGFSTAASLPCGDTSTKGSFLAGNP